MKPSNNVGKSSSASLDNQLPLLQRRRQRVRRVEGCNHMVQHLHRYILIEALSESRIQRQTTLVPVRHSLGARHATQAKAKPQCLAQPAMGSSASSPRPALVASPAWISLGSA
jgi:hypothetical protein